MMVTRDARKGLTVRSEFQQSGTRLPAVRLPSVLTIFKAASNESLAISEAQLSSFSCES